MSSRRESRISNRSKSESKTNQHTQTRHKDDHSPIDVSSESELEFEDIKCTQTTHHTQRNRGRERKNKPKETQAAQDSRNNGNGLRGRATKIGQGGKQRALAIAPKFKVIGQTKLFEERCGREGTAVCGNDDVSDVWWRQYEPKTVGDLAVHAGKIKQVKSWIEDSTAMRGNASSRFLRLLVLEGPAGAGKSTCVRVIAKELSLGIVEWINPLNSRGAYVTQNLDDEISVVHQFAAFLSRAERYPELNLMSETENGPSARVPKPTTEPGQIILVDDLPNVSHRATKESFWSALRRFVSVSSQRSFPMVLIVTESFTAEQLLSEESSGMGRRTGGGNNERVQYSDMFSWCASDLVPQDVYHSPHCQSIQFNPVAPTIVTKALKRILGIRQGINTTKNVKVSEVAKRSLKTISEECNGDLRSAINMLQMSQIGHKNEVKVVGDKRTRAQQKRGEVITFEEPSQVSASSGRRTTLDLFHALGKVLHAKREPQEDGPSERGRLESDPDEILERLPVGFDRFGLFLHENYPEYCTDIDEVVEIARNFSFSDTISSRSRMGRGGFATSSFLASSYAAIIETRGIMYVKGNPKFIDSDCDGYAQAGYLATNRHKSHHGSRMRLVRKPAFFDSYKRRIAHCRAIQDPATSLAIGAGVARSVSGGSDDAVATLPYWSNICRVRGRAGIDAQQWSKCVQLMEAVCIGGTGMPQGWGSGGSNEQLPGAAGVELSKLVLSDDDIEEFSD